MMKYKKPSISFYQYQNFKESTTVKSDVKDVTHASNVEADTVELRQDAHKNPYQFEENNFEEKVDTFFSDAQIKEDVEKITSPKKSKK